jgi:hypothetical protein
MEGCPLCDRAFRYTQIKRHMHEIHHMSPETARRIAKGATPIQCQFCYWISSSRGIHSHVRQIHPDQVSTPFGVSHPSGAESAEAPRSPLSNRRNNP